MALRPFAHGTHNPDTTMGLDSIDGAQTALEKVSRQEQSLEEHFRDIGLSSVILLAHQVGEGDELPSETLDAIITDAVAPDTAENQEANEAYYEYFKVAFAQACNVLGVDDNLLTDMFSENIETADTAIETAVETILATLPDDGEPMDTFVNTFIFGEDAGLDAMTPTAGKKKTQNFGGRKHNYTAKKVMRNGKKVVVWKRTDNAKVHLTPKQKQALTKMHIKAQTGIAKRKRVLSFKKGLKQGLYK